MGDSIEEMNFTNVFGPFNNCSGNATFNASTPCMTPEKISDDGKPPGLSSTLLLATEVVTTCLDITTVISNGVLILLIYKATKLKDGPGRLLVNQAFADGGIGILWLIVYGFLYTTADLNIIKTAMFVQRIAMFILTAESVHSLAMTLFTLHLAICNPIQYKIHNKPRYFSLFIGMSWFVNIGTWMFVFLAHNFFNFERESIMILINVTKSNAWFVALIVTVGYLAPFVVIVVCYARIWRYKNSTANHVEVQMQSTTRNTIRQAQGVLLVSVIYLMSFLPLFVFGIIGHTAPVVSAMSGNSLFILTTVLALANYLYVVVKLPLFLVAFKSYRRVITEMCCSKDRTQHRGMSQNVQFAKRTKSWTTATISSSDLSSAKTSDSSLDLNHGHVWSSCETGTEVQQALDCRPGEEINSI